MQHTEWNSVLYVEDAGGSLENVLYPSNSSHYLIMDPPFSLSKLLLHNHAHIHNAESSNNLHPQIPNAMEISENEATFRHLRREFTDISWSGEPGPALKRTRFEDPVAPPSPPQAQAARPRPSGACTRCKKVKVRFILLLRISILLGFSSTNTAMLTDFGAHR